MKRHIFILTEKTSKNALVFSKCVQLTLALLLSIMFVQAVNAQSVTLYPKEKGDPAQLIAPRGICFIPTKGVVVIDEIIGSIISLEYSMNSLVELFTSEQTGVMSPVDIACTKSGVIYIADSENNVIKKIIGEKVYTIAGTGEAGYAENYMDGGIKVYSAKYNYPMSIAVDLQENVYISDTLNHCIRKIDTKGNSSIVAGTPMIKGYKDGDTEQSYFNEPCGIAVDKKGNIYVADSGNHRIRKISNGVVTTIAGSSTYAKNSDGYLNGGFVDGYVRSAKFNFPKDVSVSEDGIIFVADTYNNAVRAIIGENVVTICGTGTAGTNYTSVANMKLNKPSGLLVQDNNLYISDTLNGNVIKLKGISDILNGIPSRKEVENFIKNIPYQQDVSVYFKNTAIGFENSSIVTKGENSEVAVKYLCDALGFPIKWDEYNKTITITTDNTEYVFDVVEDFYLYNGRAYMNFYYFINMLNIRAEWFPEQNIFVVVQ